ncbi:MAG: hypothetical protein A3G24_14005 [Betaproteobacteria bacterium RIFCSPLOWO2_12_FULL_62_13]|nr:MAG: hypothetical protein A3G24_14005 [Betaproteobacteria bacterium RIFCSPLOWO2_12_FULL_62_13]
MAGGDKDAANVYMTGAEVMIDAPVSGDLFAAAGRISVDHPVSGDAVLAAGSIDLRSGIGDDLRAAGGFVSVTGRVSGEALIAGGSIAFGPDTEVLGRVWLAGGDIAVAGSLANGLRVYGKNILLLGEVNGEVRLTGERIEILPSARINGDIIYSSNQEIRIVPGAWVRGTITRAPGSFEFPHPKFDVPGLPALRPLLFLGLLAAGALLLVLFPRFTAASLQTVQAAPLKSLGLGIAILFSLPPVILLLIITIIGVPIALALAAFYAVALLTGYLVTAFFIGEKLARAVRRQIEPTFGLRIGSLAAALLLLWLAYTIPYVGGFVILIALIVGLGAMVLQAFSSYATRA